MTGTMLVMTAGVSEDERRAIVAQMIDLPAPLELVPLTEADLDRPVGETGRTILAGRASAGDPVRTDWPLAFLAEFPRSHIDDFIAAFKRAVDRRGVFASLTPTNSGWTWRYLLEHLAEEHAAVLEMENRRG